MAKKYFWLKLQRDFFKRHDIRIIESMPNGKDYILFYLKLLVESIDHEGKLRFSDTIPYNEDMLSTITNTNVDIVRSAMKVFSELAMVEILEDKTIFMSECERMIGACSEDDPIKKENHRLRQQRYRERKKLEASRDGNVTVIRDVELEKEKEIELESDKELEIEKECECVTPTLEEVKEYVRKNDYRIDCNKFFDYYSSSNWTGVTDWKAKVRYWNAQDKEKNKDKKGKGRFTVSMSSDYNALVKGLID